MSSMLSLHLFFAAFFSLIFLVSRFVLYASLFYVTHNACTSRGVVDTHLSMVVM